MVGQALYARGGNCIAVSCVNEIQIELDTELARKQLATTAGLNGAQSVDLLTFQSLKVQEIPAHNITLSVVRQVQNACPCRALPLETDSSCSQRLFFSFEQLSRRQ